MKRRDFIFITTAGIAAISIPAYYFYLGDIEYDSSLAQPQSLSLIWDTETINAIGTGYRNQFPAEHKARSLVRQLNKDLSVGSGDLAEALEHKVAEDFETGNTVMIDGWILSVTEARQCALFSTIQSK